MATSLKITEISHFNENHVYCFLNFALRGFTSSAVENYVR